MSQPHWPSADVIRRGSQLSAFKVFELGITLVPQCALYTKASILQGSLVLSSKRTLPFHIDILFTIPHWMTWTEDGELK